MPGLQQLGPFVSYTSNFVAKSPKNLGVQYFSITKNYAPNDRDDLWQTNNVRSIVRARSNMHVAWRIKRLSSELFTRYRLSRRPVLSHGLRELSLLTGRVNGKCVDRIPAA